MDSRKRPPSSGDHAGRRLRTLDLEPLEGRILLSSPVLNAGQDAIDVELVPMAWGVGVDRSPRLPDGLDEVLVGDAFYLHVWAKNVDGSLNGITGGYVDISFDPALATAETLGHGSLYTVAPSGIIDAESGLVDDFGGQTPPGVVGFGDNEWVRLGYVECTAAGGGIIEFSAGPGVSNFTRDEEGDVPWDSIQFDEPLATLTILDFALVAEHTFGDGVTVSVYDVDPGNGVPEPDCIAWSFADFVWGRTDVVFSPGLLTDQVIDLLVLFGDGSSTADLAFVIENNVGLGSVIDARTASAPIAALSSDGYVNLVSLLGGLTGADLEGTGELTALYSGSYVGSVIARGNVEGDVVVNGDLKLLLTLGGDLNGGVSVTGGDLGTVIAQALGSAGGSIAGDLSAEGGISAVYALGGGISGSIEAEGGVVGTVLAQGSATVDGSITCPLISGDEGVGLVQAIYGDVACSISSASGSIGSVIAVRGDVDLSGGRQISSAGTINVIQAIRGDLIGDGEGAADVRVADGDLWSLCAIGGSIENLWTQVGLGGAPWGRLAGVLATEGGILGSRIEAGQLGSVYTSGDLTADITVRGALGSVAVAGRVTNCNIEVVNGSFASLWAGGDVEWSSIRLVDDQGDPVGRFGSLCAGGDLYNTSVSAGTIGVVSALGQISSDRWDEIRAALDGFWIGDEDGWHRISDTIFSWLPWLSSLDLDGLLAWIG